MPQAAYYNDFDDADLAAAIAASLQDAPGAATAAAAATSTASTVPATAPASTHNMPPLIPTRTEHRSTALPLAGTHWMGIGDDDDDTEDDR